MERIEKYHDAFDVYWNFMLWYTQVQTAVFHKLLSTEAATVVGFEMYPREYVEYRHMIYMIRVILLEIF
jgi:hypothetical protein